MPLQPGTRLGPYEILSALGAGGMGEVSRARRDGKEIYHLAPDSKMMSAGANGAAGALIVAAAEPLFQTAAIPGPGYLYDVSADGQRFVINSAVSSTAPPSLTIVFNWPQLLTKREPK